MINLMKKKLMKEKINNKDNERKNLKCKYSLMSIISQFEKVVKFQIF